MLLIVNDDVQKYECKRYDGYCYTIPKRNGEGILINEYCIKYQFGMTSEMMDDMFDDPEVDALADEETDQVLMEVAGIKMQGRLRIDIDIINRFSRC